MRCHVLIGSCTNCLKVNHVLSFPLSSSFSSSSSFSCSISSSSFPLLFLFLHLTFPLYSGSFGKGHDSKNPDSSDPAQIILLTVAINYVEEVEAAFDDIAKGNKNGLEEYKQKQVRQLRVPTQTITLTLTLTLPRLDS